MHDHTGEFSLALDGQFDIALRGGDRETGDRHEGDIPAHVDSTAGRDINR